MIKIENIDYLQDKKRELIDLQCNAVFAGEELRALSISAQIREINQRIYKAVNLKIK